MGINFKEYQHHIDLNIRFMDLDAMMHVNNARYLNFLEEARLAYSQEILGVFKRVQELNVVVARIEIDYLRPILYGEKATVLTRVKSLGNKSFTFDSIICAKVDGDLKLAAKAIQVLVAFDPKTNNSIPIPESMVEKIKAYEKLQ